MAARTLADVATAYIVIARARTAARDTADRVEASAVHDRPTGLPNRILLLQRLQEAAARAEQAQTGVAILFANIEPSSRSMTTYGQRSTTSISSRWTSSRSTGCSSPDWARPRNGGDRGICRQPRACPGNQRHRGGSGDAGATQRDRCARLRVRPRVLVRTGYAVAQAGCPARVESRPSAVPAYHGPAAQRRHPRASSGLATSGTAKRGPA